MFIEDIMPETGVPIPNEIVATAITDPNGVITTESMQTDANGVFAISFTAALTGEYIIGIAFAGDATYAPSNGSIAIIVQPGVPTATVITLTGPSSPVTVGTAVNVIGVLSTAQV